MKNKHMKSGGNKIVLCYWDGEPVWRWKTSAERLLEEIAKNIAAKKEKSL